MAAESARFERPVDFASSVLDAASAGVPLTHYGARFEAIAATTHERVALAAQRYFALERVAFIVLSSEESIARLPELNGGRLVSRQRR
jgi:predicted Zn-dependent peptidase